MGAELFHADGQIDMTKLIAAFRKFAKAPKTAVRNCSRQDIIICFTQLRTAVSRRVGIVARSACWLRHGCPSACIRAAPTERISVKFDWELS
jgi:hypothetical protein